MTGLSGCLKALGFALTAAGVLLARDGVDNCFLGCGPDAGVETGAQMSVDQDAGVSVNEGQAAVDVDAGASAAGQATAGETTGCALDCAPPASLAAEGEVEAAVAADVDGGLDAEPGNDCGCPAGAPSFEIDVAGDASVETGLSSGDGGLEAAGDGLLNGDASIIGTSIEGNATIDVDGRLE